MIPNDTKFYVFKNSILDYFDYFDYFDNFYTFLKILFYTILYHFIPSLGGYKYNEPSVLSNLDKTDKKQFFTKFWILIFLYIFAKNNRTIRN